MLSLDRSRVTPFLDEAASRELRPRVEEAHHKVLQGTGLGAEMLGWRNLVLAPDEGVLTELEDVAGEIQDRADVLLCIGIGGSYLGAEAVIGALSPYFEPMGGVDVRFAGHHLSPSYHRELLEWLDGKSVYVNVISKSGSTLEPALAFRFARRFLEERYEDASRRIIVTTGPSGGLLNPLADGKGYRRFMIPDDVGGRFSVLTPVGLLPVAAAGCDIRALMDGAGGAMRQLENPDGNPALDYVADRYLLHEAGYTTEIMATLEPRLAAFGAWWQQLFGESEGKGHKGLFPAVVQYTTDLHSLGQYVQDGRRNLVETFLLADEKRAPMTIDEEEGDPDGLNYLAGKTYGAANRAAYAGTAEAHREGGVPNWTITLPGLDENAMGQAISFFEHAVAVSGYLLDVNPFDQPGVEAYKQKMFELLGRRG
jgi:glucose-6-phosphate isomerase